MDSSQHTDNSKRKRDLEAKLERRAKKKRTEDQAAPSGIVESVPDDNVAVVVENGATEAGQTELRIKPRAAKREKRERERSEKKQNKNKNVESASTTSEHVPQGQTVKTSIPPPEKPSVPEDGVVKLSTAQAQTETLPRNKDRKKRKAKSLNGTGEVGSNKPQDPVVSQPTGQNKGTANNKNQLMTPQPTPQKQDRKAVSKAPWEVSESIAGKFIEADPIFSRDQQHFMFATEAALNAYSTLNSLLLRSMPNGSSGRTIGYCLSAIDADVLYVITDKGHVIKWNFVDGTRLGRWVVSGRVYGIQAARTGEAKVDTLFIIDQIGKGWHVSAHRFGTKDNPKETTLSTLVEIEKPIRALKIIADARVIVAMTSDGLLFGSAATSAGDDLKNFKYTWRQVQCPEAPTCFDIQDVSAAQPTNQAQKPESVARKAINVAIGGVEGSIYVYRDLLKKFGQANNTQSHAPVRMHWHREAVGSVAWSRDGNYLVSGGSETVLVLWQTETGKKQFLPHLEAIILGITVSHDGASYAVRLGDNSVMILSTSELAPTANVVGLQSFGIASISLSTPTIRTVDSTSTTSRHFPVTACEINLANPNQLLVAVPSSQARTNITNTSSSYLQIFNMDTSRHVSRQALTRTQATSTNLGPKGNRLLDPDVKFMRASADGSWLATVDEWAVPEQDSKDLSIGRSAEDAAVHDVQLKFWSWNADRQEWMLNTRIAVPHQAENSARHERILDLAVDPSVTRFATLGADSTVRVWRPRKTTSTEVFSSSKNKSTSSVPQQTETWWSMDYSISLPVNTVSDTLESLTPRRGRLEFSADGSILAVYERFEKDGRKGRDVVHFVDTIERTIRQSRADLFDGQGIHDFGFHDKYMICAGRQRLTVWDTTTFELQANVAFPAQAAAPDIKTAQHRAEAMESAPMTRLAIDSASGTFAVAVPVVAKDGISRNRNHLLNYSTQLFVYSITTPSEHIFHASLPSVTLAFLPAGGRSGTIYNTNAAAAYSKGYLVLDASACIRRIQPKSAGSKRTKLIHSSDFGDIDVVNAQPAIDIQESINGDAMDVDGGEVGNTTQDAWTSAFAQTEDSRPVVRTQELANVFDYPSHAMPSLTDMFKNVVSLYAGKAST